MHTESTAPAPTRRRNPWFVTVTVVHFVLYPVIIISAYTTSMMDFDGGPPHPAAAVLRGAMYVMSFPLVLPFYLTMTSVRGPAQWVLLLANSVCWGSAVSYAVRRLRRQ